MIEGWLWYVISQESFPSLGLEYVRNAGVNVNDDALLDGDSWGHFEVLVDGRGPSCNLTTCQQVDQDLKLKRKNIMTYSELLRLLRWQF